MNQAIEANEEGLEPVTVTTSTTAEEPNISTSTPTKTEMEILFKNLSVGGTKPAILSLIPPYSDNYVPKSSVANFPKPLKSLYLSVYGDLIIMNY